jgi:hypothetical protein
VLLIATILLFGLGLAHSVLGERYILTRLFKRENLPRLFGGVEFTKRTLRFAWHVTTVLWWGVAVILWRAATAPLTPDFVVQTIGYTAIACGILPLVITRGRHLSWLVLFVIGALCLSYVAQ